MDLETKNLLNCPDVFADISNVNLFQGKHILAPNTLTKQPTEMIYKDNQDELRHHFLDTRMKVKEKETDVAIICIENQAQMSNIMPVRDMGYRYTNYNEQIGELKKENKKKGKVYLTEEIGDKQKLIPVISMIMYYGKKSWTAPKTLTDMLEIPEKEKELWRDVITDHNIRVVELRKQDEETRKKYQTDFRHIVNYLACEEEENWEEYLKSISSNVEHPEEYLDMMSAITTDKRFREIRTEVMKQKEAGGEVSLNSIAEWLENRGIEKGKESGKTELIKNMLRNNQTPEGISSMTGEPIEYVYQVKENMLQMVHEESNYNVDI